ncbi:N-acetylglucosamine-6-phosphate deacetylase [Cohnella sp. REN36]|uniref:N-acetylglucosamine-6-phosphate deacetylase n=1 Tax=Cohnella sp. REN36 TaxID=2887347 RepID=UPI001D138E86|nr:amidohydrolase family protein [Cohnella sp. REN36]MCC3373607.1 amidohydrolase family protein [Cohnella sp. REN36]
MLQLTALHYATGKPVDIRIADGIIRQVEETNRPGTGNADRSGLCVAAPGLVDLQINGYRGNDFNQLPYSEDLVADVTRGLWADGVTTYFPTVITQTESHLTEALASIAQACRRDPASDRAIAGIHLEGPFLSPEDGARGAHPRSCIRPPDWTLFCRWQEAAEGRIRILTLSPEWPGSADFISKCADSGVTVSIGHTSASPEQIREAVRAGARMSTHLGNGAHLMLPRHPNYLWEQLAQDELWSCVIADGFHLPDAVLKVVMRMKGPRAMLVSDAVALSGMPPGAYTSPIGGEVVLTKAGKLHLAADENLLAGSAQMQLRGVERLAERGLASLEEAWDMASVRPAGFMKLPSSAGLAPGAPADLVLFRRERHDIEMERVYKAGTLVFGKESYH